MANQDMLVNYVRGEECRIAIIEDGKLEEFYSERASADLHVGNIYRGKVTNVEPSIQAAFIDFGLERSGFLHVTDLHPRYFRGEKKEELEAVGQKTPRRDRPPIQQCLRRGQEILVQVLKEGIGSKGPTLTSYLSIPGRFMVMMPYMERHGVSRKIEDPEKRRQIHKILDELNPPENFGFIVRTAGLDRPKTELKRDLAFLMRLWKDMEHRMNSGHGPAELYAESDLMTRTLRDVVTADVRRIIVDDREMALRARQFLRLATPRSATKVIHYNKPVPLFDAFDVERQIQSIHDRVVPLPSGGSLVFDSTEALVAIDVNSGKSRENADAETTAYKTNLEAVDEIARQLRLRDLGGLIVLDLIDMYKLPHRRGVEKRFKDHLKNDRARTKDLRISELGLLELTRQRMRPSLKKSVFCECATCRGAGLVLSLESVVLSVMRRLAVALHAPTVHRVEVSASAEVLTALLNRRRESITQMERSSERRIVFTVDPAAGPDTVAIACFEEKGLSLDPSRMPMLRPPEFTVSDEVVIDDLKELDELTQFDEFEDEAEEGDVVQTAPAAAVSQPAMETGEAVAVDGSGAPVGVDGTGRKRRRRRRRRGGRSGAGAGVDGGEQAPPTPQDIPKGEAPQRRSYVTTGRSEGYEAGPRDLPIAVDIAEDVEPGNVRIPDTDSVADTDQPNVESSRPGSDGATQTEGGRRRRRRRGGRRRRRGGVNGAPQAAGGEDQAQPQPEPTAAAEPAGDAA